MGIGKPIDEYEKGVLTAKGLKYDGLKWCEFGDQVNWEKRAAKDVYTSLGVDHVSIDLNCRNGAMPVDLCQPLPFIFLNQFDVVTNYGTLEHVNDQFQAFKNMHDMCKVEGIMIHVMPLIGNWPGHCRYYYSERFAQELATTVGYKLLSQEVLDKERYAAPDNLLAFSLVKISEQPFTTEGKFDAISGVEDTGDMEKTGNYSKPKGILRRTKKIILKMLT